MAKFDNPLNNLKVASPCSQDWEGMLGDNRKRYCGECKLNVYNLSGMTKTEAENLLMNSEGRLCVRFFQRADGTILTQDCPVGWAKVKERTKVFVTAAFSLVLSLFSGLLFVSAFSRSKEIGKKFPLPIPFTTPSPEPLMGAIAAPTPTPKATPTATPKPREVKGEVAYPEDYKMGKIVVRNQ
ncbi:MAG TPA: hypothetical protein PKY59_22320 [Pyrinomonadaceae bacterium]|nr:hypothetical protein [Pyrinomonadaceae bacterium]